MRALNIFLRVLRIIAFIGALMVFLLVVVFNIPFLTVFNRGLALGDLTGYLCCFSVSLLFAYPAFFLISVIVMKIQGWHVYAVYGHGELSLFDLFLQNELHPFRRFLFDKFTTVNTSRFPYNVDFGHTKCYSIMKVLASIYRLIRAILILGVISAAFYFSASFIARTI